METEQHHHDQERLITVKKLHDEVEALLVKGLLEAGGVLCEQRWNWTGLFDRIHLRHAAYSPACVAAWRIIG